MTSSKGKDSNEYFKLERKELAGSNVSNKRKWRGRKEEKFN